MNCNEAYSQGIAASTAGHNPNSHIPAEIDSYHTDSARAAFVQGWQAAQGQDYSTVNTCTCPRNSEITPKGLTTKGR